MITTGQGRNGEGKQVESPTAMDPAFSDVTAIPARDTAPPKRESSADPLAYLPCSAILDYARGEQVYSRLLPSSSLYMVIDGKVKVCRTADDGSSTVIDIYLPDEFFGESAFLGERHRVDEAIAIDATRLMCWPAEEVQRLIVEQPRLGIALVRLLAQRIAEFGERIESYSADTIDRRLARTLIRFSNRFGQESEDGCVDMMPFTHELLAQYVGTAREVVTHYMSQLRSQGYVEYSRRGIVLHREKLREWLQCPVADAR